MRTLCEVCWPPVGALDAMDARMPNLPACTCCRSTMANHLDQFFLQQSLLIHWLGLLNTVGEGLNIPAADLCDKSAINVRHVLREWRLKENPVNVESTSTPTMI